MERYLSPEDDFTNEELNETGREWIEKELFPFCSVIKPENWSDDFMVATGIYSSATLPCNYESDATTSNFVSCVFTECIASAVGLLFCSEFACRIKNWKQEGLEKPGILSAVKKRYDLSSATGPVKCCPESFDDPVFIHNCKNKDIEPCAASCFYEPNLPSGVGLLADRKYFSACIFNVLVTRTPVSRIDETEDVRSNMMIAYDLPEKKAIIYTGIEKMKGVAIF